MKNSQPVPSVTKDDVFGTGHARITGYAGRNYTTLLGIIGLLLVIFTIATFNKRSLTITFAGWAAILSGGVPIVLWVRGVVPGLPVYPLFALCYLITYALQFLLNTQKKLDAYSSSSIWGASGNFCLFMLSGTVAWAFILKIPRKIPASVRVFAPGQGDVLLLFALAVSDLFLIFTNAKWIPISTGLFAIARAFIVGMSALSIFVIAFRSASGQLPPKYKILFTLLMIVYVISSAVTLFLVGAITAMLMMSVGYALGGNAVPWKLLGTMLFCISILHFGKFEMREAYWIEGGQGFQVMPWEYPKIYKKWIEASLDSFSIQDREIASIYERSSLLDILLMVREATPETLPYLNGETYELLPQVFMPRFFNSEKISTHEADTILNVYYGKQTRESASSTTFGWGLLNESYANYGLAGALLVGAITGLIYGSLTRISLFQPLLSLPSLLSLTAISFAIQTESASTYLVAALFQTLIAVSITCFVFMRKVSYELAMSWQKL